MAFKKGQSGNPNGRPKGARHRLSEAFWADFADAWKDNGKAALAAVARDDPSAFVRAAASVMPKEIEATVRNINAKQLSDDELANIATGSSDGTADEAEATQVTH